MPDGYGVTESELRTAGGALVDAAEGAKTGGSLGGGGTGGMSALSGATSGASTDGGLDGFSIRSALNTCESQWEDAIDSILAKVSLTGDKIVLAADNYGEQEYNTAETFSYFGEDNSW